MTSTTTTTTTTAGPGTNTMTLWGTTTSPFVRRVRIVAAELGVPYLLQNGFAPEHREQFAKRSPIGKVPTMELDGRIVWDSHAIIDFLHARAAPSVRSSLYFPPVDAWDTRNLMNAVDEALVAGIKLFYMKRDGVDERGVANLERERQRLGDVFGWLDGQVRGGFASDQRRFGVPEIVVLSALDWMRFRAVYDWQRHGNLVELMQLHGARPSVSSTVPAA